MWFSPDSRHITVGLTYCTSNTQDTFYPLPAPAMPVYETFFLYNREILIVWHTCMLNILHMLPKMREVYKIRLTQNSVLLKQQLYLETYTHLYLSVSALLHSLHSVFVNPIMHVNACFHQVSQPDCKIETSTLMLTFMGKIFPSLVFCRGHQSFKQI